MSANGFRFYFTPLTGVLFTFPSRYWFTIGHQGVFSLGTWSSQIPTRFLGPRGTQDLYPTSQDLFADRAITFSGRTLDRSAKILIFDLPTVPYDRPTEAYNTEATTHTGLTSLRFRLFPFRSPLLGESLLISLPAGTEMFHFPAWASRFL